MMEALMIRKKRISGEARKVQILRSALPLFAKGGLSGTTTRELSNAAGVSEALIYKHFPSKESLYEEIQVFCLNKARVNNDILLGLDANTENLMNCIYFAVYTVLNQEMVQEDMDDSDFHRLVVYSLLEDGEFAFSFLNKTCQIWREKIEECTIAARELGDITISHKSTTIFPWLVQHLINCYAYKQLSEKQLVDYGISDMMVLIDEFSLFALRGMGINEAAIDRYFHPEKLLEF